MEQLAIWFWPHGMSGLVGSGRWLQTWRRGLPPLVLQFPAVLRHLPRLKSTQMSSLKRRGSMLYLMLGGIVVGHCCCWNCCCWCWCDGLLWLLEWLLGWLLPFPFENCSLFLADRDFWLTKSAHVLRRALVSRKGSMPLHLDQGWALRSFPFGTLRSFTF